MAHFLIYMEIKHLLVINEDGEFMAIFAFIPEFGSNEIRLEDKILKSDQGPEIVVFRLLFTFHRFLKGNPIQPDLTLIMAKSRKQLTDLLSLQPLLSNVPIIIILPDHERDTFSIGCQFRPRFISYADSGFEDVVAVLQNVVNNGVSRSYLDGTQWLIEDN